MTHNSTTGLYAVAVPAQPNRSRTVRFFIVAYDVAGNLNTTPTYSYDIKSLILGDINGDGVVSAREVNGIHVYRNPKKFTV